MNKTLLVFLALLGLVGSACGAGDTEVSSSPSSDGSTTTTDEPIDLDDQERSAVGGRADDVASEADPVAFEPGTLGAHLQAETMEATSGRFEGTFIVNGPAGSGAGSMTLSMTGSFDNESRAMEMTVDTSGLATDSSQVPPQLAPSLTEPAQVRVIGDELYLKWGLLAMFTGAEDGWLLLPAEDFSTAAGDYGVQRTPTSPTDLLDAYGAAATGPVEDLGVETLRGAETRHHRLLIDLRTVAELAALAEPAQGGQLETDLEAAGISEIPVDLWIGVDDGLLHQFETLLTVQDASGTGTVSISFELFDFGADVEIAPPPSSEIVETPTLPAF